MSKFMEVADAWMVLGEDPSALFHELVSHPDVPSRVKAAEAALVRAERIGKALLSVHHPDKNPGDCAAAGRFRRVMDALESIRHHTEEFKRTAANAPDGKKGPTIVIG